MFEAKRFDPLGWLLSLSFGLLTAAGALALAIYLIRQIWPWLLTGVVAAGVAVMTVRLAVWWHRRRSW